MSNMKRGSVMALRVAVPVFFMLSFLAPLRSFADMETGLVGWWKFDEGSGTSVLDSSSFGNNAVISGNASLSSGKLGNALSLGGSDGMALAPHSASLSMKDRSASVCFWFQNKNAGKTGGIAGKNFASVYSYGVYYLGSSGEFRVSLRNSAYDSTYGIGIFPALNSWVHACAVISDNGTGTTIKSYENGSFKKTVAGGIRIGDASGYGFAMGSYGSYKTGIEGIIDDVRVYNRALSPSEVAEIYAYTGNTLPPPITPPANPPPPVQGVCASSLNSCSSGVLSDVPDSLAQYLWNCTGSNGGSTASCALSIPYLPPAVPSGLPSDTITTSPSVTCCTGRGWYASPSGTSGGDGSISKPWDLGTALKKTGVINPGDVLWLRGGTYRGAFTSYLSGTASSPVVVRNWNSERAILDGNNGGSDTNTLQVLNVAGKYIWFWGLEITDSVARRDTLIDPRTGADNYWKSMDDVKKRMGVTHLQDGESGTGSRFINMIVHDAKQGFSLWSDASDMEAYGNIVYNNGYGAPDRGHGHGFYVQNRTGSKWITDNIVFNNYDNNLQIYGSSDSYIANIYMDGNALSNPGVVSGTEGGNIVLYGGNTPKNIHFTNNSTYATPGRTNSVSRIGLSSPQADADIRNNFFGNAVDVRYWDSLRFTGNTIVVDPKSKINFYAGRDPKSAPYLWDNNKYYSRPGDWGDFLLALDYGGSYRSLAPSFSSWKSQTGFDGGTEYFLNQAPSSPFVFVRPNRYEPGGRAHIIIFNYPKSPSVSVDLSKSGLKDGDSYSIKNAGDLFGDPKVVTGTYRPLSPIISFPMIGWTAPASPLGGSITPPATLPEFGIFLLLKNGTVSAPAPDIMPPSVSITSPQNGSAVSGNSVVVSASASDNLGISSVEFKLDGNSLFEDTSPPYSMVWNTTLVSNGTRSLTATAKDQAGNIRISSVAVTVSNPIVLPTRFYHYTEMEDATIVSPVLIISSSTASRGKYIYSSGSMSGSASFAFTAPFSDTYYLWGRVFSPSSASDSFFVGVDGGGEDVWDSAEGLWSSSWQWTRVTGRAGNGGLPVSLNVNGRKFNLGAGVHTFVFRGREAGTILDRVLITNDLNFVPVGQVLSENVPENPPPTLPSLPPTPSPEEGSPDSSSGSAGNLPATWGGSGGGGTSFSVPLPAPPSASLGGQTFSSKSSSEIYSSASSSTAGSHTGNTGLSSLSTLMYPGVRGNDVKNLQNFLASQELLSPDMNSGYYGTETRKAVEEFQKKNGIVSGGSPESTGFGIVGSKTRSKVNEIILKDKNYPQTVSIQKMSSTEREAKIQEIRKKILELTLLLLQMQMEGLSR